MLLTDGSEVVLRRLTALDLLTLPVPSRFHIRFKIVMLAGKFSAIYCSKSLVIKITKIVSQSVR